jgi:hypothetical protein
MNKALAVLLALFMLPALAADWTETASTRAFRQRVLDLALKYDSSGGIDENGFLIQAAVRAGSIGQCKTIQVRITRNGQPVREEAVRVCPTD